MILGSPPELRGPFNAYDHGVWGLGHGFSLVAAVVDVNGDMRVIVDGRMTEDSVRQRKLVLDGEELFVVPGLVVREPVPWDAIPWFIATCRRYVAHVRARKNTVFDPYAGPDS